MPSETQSRDTALEMPHLIHGELRPIPSIFGHLAGGPFGAPRNVSSLCHAGADKRDHASPRGNVRAETPTVGSKSGGSRPVAVFKREAHRNRRDGVSRGQSRAGGRGSTGGAVAWANSFSAGVGAAVRSEMAADSARPTADPWQFPGISTDPRVLDGPAGALLLAEDFPLVRRPTL